MHTDPIADMLTRIRNANQALHPETSMPSSKLKVEIAKILATEGFVDSYREEDAPVGKKLTVRLRYGADRSRVVDAVVGRSVYMLLADPAAAVREARRVLRPGGCIAFTAFTTPGCRLRANARKKNGPDIPSHGGLGSVGLQ